MYKTEQEKKEARKNVLKKAYAKWHFKRFLLSPQDELWRNNTVRQLSMEGVPKVSIMRRMRLSRQTIDSILKIYK
jgi:hypothetical protein